jgi:urease alpha subunit
MLHLLNLKLDVILSPQRMTYEALSFYCTNSQAIGRVGKVATRAWQIADKMRRMTGRLKKENGHNNNLRVKHQ